jgi:hypothetical protein
VTSRSRRQVVIRLRPVRKHRRLRASIRPSQGDQSKINALEPAASALSLNRARRWRVDLYFSATHSILAQMPFTDLEIVEHIATIERELWSRRRPPLHLRPKVREGQRFEGYSVEFFFVRPRYMKPKEYAEHPFAKVRFIRSRGVWRLFWQRADLKWHGYQPAPETTSLAAALRIVNEDAFNCFFG